MKLASFEAIVRSFDEAGVRYLVAGGLAVNAHGYMRLTKDVDLVLDLRPDNVKRALHALDGLGYRPTVPVAAAQFADPEQRWRWMKEAAGRAQDRIDIEHLRATLEENLEER